MISAVQRKNTENDSINFHRISLVCTVNVPVTCNISEWSSRKLSLVNHRPKNIDYSYSSLSMSKQEHTKLARMKQTSVQQAF